MSKATFRPAARAIRIAFLCAAAGPGLEKCVPVTTIAPAERMKLSSMSASESAMSAQFSR